MLAQPRFRLYAVSRVTGSIAMTLLQAVIAWQVYAISDSALDLGLIGLVRFAPALGASLIGGAVVDAYDRRAVLLLSLTVPLAATLAVLAAIAAGPVSLPFLYGIVFVTGLATSFESPARQVLLPAVVPWSLFSRAITVNSTLQSLAFVTGPALGGGLIALGGVGAAYVAHGALVAVSLAAVWMLRVDPATGAGRSGVHLGAIREAISFVRQRPVLIGSMTLDMVAVIFGGAKALLPVYAVDILQVGSTGYGILAASMEFGALVMSLALLTLPAPSRTGQTLLASVAAFGVATMVFGASTWFPLSIVAYAAVGMADQLSVVMRINTVQLSTPDELRGRVTAVNSIFVGASNQIGAVESGLVAAATNAVFAVVSGGAACLAFVSVMAWRVPELRAYRAAAAASLKGLPRQPARGTLDDR